MLHHKGCALLSGADGCVLALQEHTQCYTPSNKENSPRNVMNVMNESNKFTGQGNYRNIEVH